MTRQLSAFSKLLLACIVAGSFIATTISARDQGIEQLEKDLLRLSKASGGELGVTAIHIETGRRASLNGSTQFPMASTYKVPMAIQLLTLVDEGKERLDRMMTIEPKDLHPDGGPLWDQFSKPGGQAVSVKDLLEMMLTVSDNSAADLILRLAGGPQAVTARVRSI